MKEADIKVGEVYLTRIGESLCRVIVVQKREGYRLTALSKKSRTTFDVRRENEDRVLPKPRSAAALRPVK